MSTDICCVINAHREGVTLFPTIASVKRAVKYAELCGLKCSIHIILDNPDEATREVAERELTDVGVIHSVDYRDLAHSRNHAAEFSDGRYMAFVDGDDLWGRNWLVNSYLLSERTNYPSIFHPEYNIIFGDENSHVFNHVDMDDDDFEFETLYRMNYWTALSFARTETYRTYPYQENTILDGFGYEDWNWNYETIQQGFRHKTVPGTVHFIRKGRPQDSLLAMTNKLNALPRIYNIYRKSVTKSDNLPHQAADLVPSNHVDSDDTELQAVLPFQKAV